MIYSWVSPDIDTFLFDPQSTNVTEGETVAFECVTGYSAPPSVVHWERNGQLVTEQTDEAYYGTVIEGKNSYLFLIIFMKIFLFTHSHLNLQALRSLNERQ